MLVLFDVVFSGILFYLLDIMLFIEKVVVMFVGYWIIIIFFIFYKLKIKDFNYMLGVLVIYGLLWMFYVVYKLIYSIIDKVIELLRV